MPTPEEQYIQHLATLGVNLASVECDESGTVRQSVSPSAPSPAPVRLPVLRTQDSEHAAADVRLGALLGEGGMGRVVEAEQVALRRSVAVKTAHGDGQQGFPTDLLREALVAARLEHPNIVPVYLLGTTPDGVALFVMRRVVGVP